MEELQQIKQKLNSVLLSDCDIEEKITCVEECSEKFFKMFNTLVCSREANINVLNEILKTIIEAREWAKKAKDNTFGELNNLRKKSSGVKAYKGQK